MGPAESQDDHPVLDPAHRLVGRIAVDHQHPARLGPKVVLGDRVTATGIQQIDHRVRTQHDPQPPAVSLLAFQDDEHRPPRLIGLMQVPLPIPLLERLVNRPQQDFQPLQAVGDGARCQVQTQQPPRGQQAFRGPIAEILVQEDLDPHRDAVSSFGDQLGRRRGGEGDRAVAGAGPLVAPPPNHPAVGTHFDLDLLRVFGVAAEKQRLAATGADTLLGRQFDGIPRGPAGGSNPVAWGPGFSGCWPRFRWGSWESSWGSSK